MDCQIKNKIKIIAATMLLAIISFTLLTGCSTNDETYTFIWMSDTQGYSQESPKIYNSMTNWIKTTSKEDNIKFLFHTGDIIDDCEKKQWQNADNAMKKVDGVVPYTVAAGNHDVKGLRADYKEFLSYFGKNRFKNESDAFYYKNGIASAKLINAGSEKYIMTAIGFAADSAAEQWLKSIINRYSDKIAVLTTHDYMNADGSLSDNGKKLYKEIVVPCKNVRLVLCGHNHNAALNTAKIDDGGATNQRTVYQMLADYQMQENMGNGFLRLLTVNEKTKTLTVKTYSPYINKYNCFKKSSDDFEVSIKDWF